MPLLRRTRAIFRKAEFGFFGVIVRTWVHTPRFWGFPLTRLVVLPDSALYVKRNAGAFSFFEIGLRPLRTNWLMVGKIHTPLSSSEAKVAPGSGHA